MVFRRSDVNTFVNVGPHTAPETFQLADNFWYCEDRPAASRPSLPAAETGGVYGVDPQLSDPARHQVTIDLPGQEVLAADKRYAFVIEPAAKRMLVEGLDAIALTQTRWQLIESFHEQRKQLRPWLY